MVEYSNKKHMYHIQNSIFEDIQVSKNLQTYFNNSILPSILPANASRSTIKLLYNNFKMINLKYQ